MDSCHDVTTPLSKVLVIVFTTPITITGKELGHLRQVVLDLFFVLLPHLGLLFYNLGDEVLEQMLKLAELKQQANHGSWLHNVRDDLLELWLCGMLMEHDPSNCRVGVSQATKQVVHVSKGLILLELTFDDVLIKPLAVCFESLEATCGKEFDLFGHDVVFHGFHGGRERPPEADQVDKLTSIDRDHPVVREMLVANFAHFGLVIIQNKRNEWEEAEDNRSLLGKGL